MLRSSNPYITIAKWLQKCYTSIVLERRNNNPKHFIMEANEMCNFKLSNFNCSSMWQLLCNYFGLCY